MKSYYQKQRTKHDTRSDSAETLVTKAFAGALQQITPELKRFFPAVKSSSVRI